MGKDGVIFECRQHWSAFIPQWIFAGLFLLSGLGSIMDGDISTMLFSTVIAMVFVAYIFISQKTTCIRLTKTKIEGHKGIINSKTMTTPLKNVQNISISNGLIGKILNYHTVTISDAGNAGTEYVFKRMANAKEFANAVKNEIAK